MFEKLKSLVTRAPKGQGNNESLMWNVVGNRSVPKRASVELVNAYKNTPWLRAVASRVATAVASTRWELYKAVGSDGKAKRVKSLQRSKGAHRQKLIHKMAQAGELVEIEEHPLLEMLHHGNRMLPGHSSMEVTQLHLDIQGESFWFLDKNLAGMPTAYWPIPPNWISKVPTPDEPWFTLQYNATRTNIPVEMMLWFRYPDPGNPFSRGTGVAESMGDELDTDEYAAKYIKSFFYNHGTPDALIGLKGANKKELEEAQARWDQRYRGQQNAHRTAFHNGEIDVEVLSATFRDQQVTELREAARNTIVQVFGVPPECVGIIENSNRATIDAAMFLMAMYVTVPRLERIRDLLQDQLVPMFDERLVIGYESPIPDDREYKLSVMQAQPGAVTRAEWREAAGLESHGYVDEVYIMSPNDSERHVTDQAMYMGNGEMVGEEPDDTPEMEDDDPEDGDYMGDMDEEDDDEEATARWQGKSVRKADETDIEHSLLALDPEILTADLGPVVKSLVEKWGMDELAALGLAQTFNSINPRVTEHLRELALEHLRDVNQTTKEALRDTLIEGVRAGESIKLLSGRVGSVFEDAEGYRATRIARTEVLRSSNFASWEAQVQSGVVQVKQWVATSDDRTRETHQDLNGQTRGLHEPFSVSGKTAMYPGDFGDPAEDVNCFVPGTKVSGNILGAARVYYRGPIVELKTARGNILAVTPNHPILTMRGQIAAKDIKQGDEVLCSLPEIGGAAKQIYGDNAPSTVDKIFDALSISGFSATVRRDRKYLHGDAQFGQGDIDVVSLNRVLGIDREPGILYNAADLVLKSANAFAPAGSSLHKGALIIEAASSGNPSGAALSFDGDSTSFYGGPFKVLGVGASAQMDSRFSQAGSQTRTRDAKFVADLLQRCAGFVELDNVVEIRDVAFDGHVYDLQSVSGLIVAGALIVSNCRCTTIPVVEGYEPKATAELEVVWKAYDKKLLPWEKQVRAALRKAFKQQREDIIDALYSSTS